MQTAYRKTRYTLREESYVDNFAKKHAVENPLEDLQEHAVETRKESKWFERAIS